MKIMTYLDPRQTVWPGVLLSRLPRRGFDDGRPKQRDCRDSCGGLALHDLVDF